MRRYSILIFLIALSIFFGHNSVFAYQNCDSLANTCIYRKGQYDNSYYYDANYSYYYSMYSSSCNEYQDCFSTLQQQQQDVSLLMSNGFDNYQAGEYEESLSNYQKALNIIDDRNDDNYKISQGNIVLCYNELGNLAVVKEDYKSALSYFNKSLKIDNKNVVALFKIGIINFDKEEYKIALDYFKKSYKYSTNYDDISSIKEFIDYTEYLIQELKNQKNNVTNDFFSYKSLLYLIPHHIVDARRKVKRSEAKQVIVAIIDDGIHINHPDLSENIRVNVGEIPNDGKDNDNNGYKDDFNGWNFVYNNNNVLPLGSHGTMVAGIIGAIQENGEGIAGISKNIKMMPIGVCTASSEFGEGECKTEDIIKGINYAIDNGADIINLSLGGSQFEFDNSYTKAIERAYRKGIIVVVAAGNGDLLSYEENGINTTVNRLSPICNYGNNPKSIIGVSALDGSGYLAPRSNYGECAQFSSFGEQIFSTVIPGYSSGRNYEFGNGTSFATPIIAGIIALGFNKYGQVRGDLVWDALQESKGTGYLVDASKYIDILGTKINENPLDYKTIQLEGRDKFTYNVSEFYYDLQKKFNIFLSSFRKSESTLESIKSAQLGR